MPASSDLNSAGGAVPVLPNNVPPGDAEPGPRGQESDGDLIGAQEALHTGAGAVALDRSVLRVHGPDAADYLQGQLSQDVEALAAGDAAWAFLLAPRGRVVAWLRVTRETDDAFLLDTDAAAGDAVLERLARFKLRTKADLDPLAWGCVALRGAQVTGLALDAASVGADTVVAQVPWPSGPVVDLLGPAPQIPPGATPCPYESYEALRIEQGVPAMGSEVTEATIPAEAGRFVIDASVSFTKGCYTGQELVARVNSRGSNVPKPVRGLVVHGEQVPAPGTPLVAGTDDRAPGKEVGHVTSAAWSRRAGGPVALAVVARSVAVGTTVQVGVATGESAATAVATVHDLPLALRRPSR